jgi:hypothetical protein
MQIQQPICRDYSTTERYVNLQANKKIVGGEMRLKSGSSLRRN